MMNLKYSQVKALIEEIGRFEEENYTHYGLDVISVGSAEYAIGTDIDADYAWDEALDNYLEEVIYPELPDNMVSYFDDEAWKREARYDGRGHSLSSYDGCEINISDLVLFRIN